MTFDFDEVKNTLTVSTDDGQVRKYIFRDPVGSLFSLILQQLEDCSGGGQGVSVATWAEQGNVDPIPTEKIVLSSSNLTDNADILKVTQVSEWAKVDDTSLIPADKLPAFVDDVVDVDTLPETGEKGKIYILPDNTQWRWSGTSFAQIVNGGIVIGTITGTAYDGGKGTELEGKVSDLEATVSDKLGVNDVSAWAKAQDPTTIPLEKMDENVVEYSDFSYVPGGESDPVERKTIQLKNYDSISGMNTAGNDAANLIMMSKWDKVDIGSSRYPVNLNGSEFTLNDNRDIAKVYETNGLTDLSEGESDSNIRSALGLEFDKFIEIIQDKDVVIVDRNSAGDYKTCIHASGNISGGNGAANLMFFIGTDPTIFQVQYVNGTFALAVIKYEFAEKDEIPSLDGYATTQNVSDSVAAEASARDKAIETATSDLVHNTLTVAGKSLTGNITLASTDLTDGTTLAQKSEIPTSLPNPNALTINYNGTQAFTYDGSQSETGNFIVNAQTVPMSEDDETTISAKFDEYAKKDEILDTVVDENTNETLRQALTARTHLPFARNTPLENQTEAQIFALFNESITDKAGLRTYLQSNMAYIAYNLNSLGQHQYYKLPIMLASIPDSGDITVIAMGPDIYNSDLMTKFTYTIVLNGDASSVTINKKVLES